MKLYPWVPANLEVCSVDFDYVDFRKTIFQKGNNFWWEKGCPCPCRQGLTVGVATTVSLDSYQPIMNCPSCNGTGVRFMSGQRIKGVLSGYNETQVLSKYFGRLQPGDIHVTFLREHLPDVNDRFVFLDDQKIYYEVRRRGEGSKQRLRFPVKPRAMNLGDPAGTPTEEPVVTSVGVTYLAWADASGEFVTADGTEGVHFEIDNGEIDFTLGDDLGESPAEGAPFAVRYYSYPIYKVAEIVHVHRAAPFYLDDGTQQVGDGPVRVLLSVQTLGVEDNPTAAWDPDA